MDNIYNFKQFQLACNNIQTIFNFERVSKQISINYCKSYFFQSIQNQFLKYRILPQTHFKQKFWPHNFSINYQSNVYLKVS